MKFNFKLLLICLCVFSFGQFEARAATVKVKNTSMMQVLSYIGAGTVSRLPDRTVNGCDVWANILTNPTPIVIDSGYDRTGRVLVIWSLDVYGNTSSNSGALCYPAPAGGLDGSVITKVSVVGTALESDEASLVIPKNLKNNINVTGSFVLTPDDFGGTLPANISLNLAWSNHSSQELTCSRRSMTVVVARD